MVVWLCVKMQRRLKGIRTQLYSLAGLSMFQPYVSGNQAVALVAVLVVGHLLSQIGPQRLAGLLVPLHHFIGLFFIVQHPHILICLRILFHCLKLMVWMATAPVRVVPSVRLLNSVSCS